MVKSSMNKRLENLFSSIDFFNSDNTQRYYEYLEIHPDLAADEIVWRVNNNLDKEKYHFDVDISDVDDPYIVVNKYFKIPQDYCPTDLVSVDGALMRKDTAKAYVIMRDDAKSKGFSIRVTSAYRSIEEQTNLYNKFLIGSSVEIVDETCARPCYSEHHTGLAVDVEGSIPGGRNISKTPEAKWVKENCFKYGFILRYLPETVEITGYASEPWHLRYVGKQVSMDMNEKNIKTLEEYRERYLKRKN